MGGKAAGRAEVKDLAAVVVVIPVAARVPAAAAVVPVAAAGAVAKGRGAEGAGILVAAVGVVVEVPAAVVLGVVAAVAGVPVVEGAVAIREAVVVAVVPVVEAVVVRGARAVAPAAGPGEAAVAAIGSGRVAGGRSQRPPALPPSLFRLPHSHSLQVVLPLGSRLV